MWNLPRPGIKPVFPAMIDRLLKNHQSKIDFFFNRSFRFTVKLRGRYRYLLLLHIHYQHPSLECSIHYDWWTYINMALSYMFMDGWVPSLITWNYHNIVNRLHPSAKSEKEMATHSSTPASENPTFHFHALEKEMATYSSILACRIPGTKEPGGLPSMGSHRVRHDWSDLAAAAAATVQNKNCLKRTYYYHPKLIVYIRSHSSCCIFFETGQVK